MLRIRTAALTLAAAAAALTVGLSAEPAVAHSFDHHGFFGHHHRHGLMGVIQSVDTSNDTAVVALGGDRQSMHRDWDHAGSSDAVAKTVTLDLSNAAIVDATRMQKDCNGPDGTANPSSVTTTSLSSVQQGDKVIALLAVNHSTARQDLVSGTAIPVSKLVDFGQSSSRGSDQQQSARRFFTHA